MSNRFYYGQQDYIVQLNLMADAFDAGPYSALPTAGGTMTGQLVTSSGTVSAPGIGIGANNSGFYRPATNQIGVSINGANVATWNSTGLSALNLSLTNALSIANGGTGSTTADAARLALNAQVNLGYMPVQQGGGPRQGNNGIQLGWTNAANLALAVDGTDIGDIALQSQVALKGNITSLGRRNRIDNGNFNINQRVVSGTVTLAAGAYGHDRWKAGTSGCTYTFSTTQGITTLTITAGTLIQVIDGTQLMGSVTHVASWVGTCTGRIGTGSFVASGFTSTLVGGTNYNLEFGTGTLSRVQVEPGSVVTPFEWRTLADEMIQCQRYFERILNVANQGYVQSGTNLAVWISFKVSKRAIPQVTIGAPSVLTNLTGGNVQSMTTEGALLLFTGQSSNNAAFVVNMVFSSEL